MSEAPVNSPFPPDNPLQARLETVQALINRHQKEDVDFESFYRLGLKAVAQLDDERRVKAGLPLASEQSFKNATDSQQAKDVFEYGRAGGIAYGLEKVSNTLPEINKYSPQMRVKNLFVRTLPGKLNIKIYGSLLDNGERSQDAFYSNRAQLAGIYQSLEEAEIPLSLQGALAVDLIRVTTTEMAFNLVRPYLQAAVDPNFAIQDPDHYFPTIIHQNYKNGEASKATERSINFYSGYVTELSSAVRSEFNKLYGDNADLALELWRTIIYAKSSKIPEKSRAKFRLQRLEIFKILSEGQKSPEKLAEAKNNLVDLYDTYGAEVFTIKGLQTIGK